MSRPSAPMPCEQMRDRQLGPDLDPDRLGALRLVVVIVPDPDLQRRPQAVGHRVVERERTRVRAFDGVGAVQVQLDVVVDAEVELEVRDHEAPRAGAADGAELQVHLGDARLFPFEVRRLEPRPRPRADAGGQRDRRRHQRAGDDRAGGHRVRRDLPRLAPLLGLVDLGRLAGRLARAACSPSWRAGAPRRARRRLSSRAPGGSWQTTSMLLPSGSITNAA